MLYQTGGPTPSFTTAVVAFDPTACAGTASRASRSRSSQISADRDGDRGGLRRLRDRTQRRTRRACGQPCLRSPGRCLRVRHDARRRATACSSCPLPRPSRSCPMACGLRSQGRAGHWDSQAAAAPVGTFRDRSSLSSSAPCSVPERTTSRVDPEQLPVSASRLQVGEMRLQIPAGMKLVHSDYTTRGIEQTVLVTLSTPTGNCDVTSTYDNGAGGGAHPWSAYASGLTWSGRATFTDAVKVVCGPIPWPPRRSSMPPRPDRGPRHRRLRSFRCELASPERT